MVLKEAMQLGIGNPFYGESWQLIFSKELNFVDFDIERWFSPNNFAEEDSFVRMVGAGRMIMIHLIPQGE